MSTQAEQILTAIQAVADPDAVAGMTRYGIVGSQVYGVKIPVLRAMAKEIGYDHELAQELWAINSRETRVLATMVDHWKQVTPEQMDAWAAEFDSWEVCDQACSNLFGRTPCAHDKALAWSERPEEFVKRAGFVLMAVLSHKKSKTPPEQLAEYLPIIRRESGDDRNFVKKAVNWALRDIGKSSLPLNTAAIETAERLVEQPSKSATWIGRDALRELTSEKVQARLAKAPAG